jgi:FeS assembly SUF system protein
MWRKQSEFEEAHAPATPPPADEASASKNENAAASDAGSSPAGGTSPAVLRENIIAELKTVFDPEIPVNIYELGLIYEVDVADDGKTKIRMTLTTPMCPAAEELPPEVETKARGVAGVTGVELDLVWEPPWSPDMMSEAAKLELGMV